MIVPDWTTVRPIPVKKYSQVDAGSGEYRNDCGAGMGMSLLSGYKHSDMTVTDFYERALVKMGYPHGSDVYLSIASIQGVLKDEGVIVATASYQSMSSLFSWFYEGKPVGILINNYGILVDAGLTEFKNFRGAHFVTAIGTVLGREQYIAVYDPYTTTEDISFWDTKNFYDAWSYGGTQNAPRQVLVPTQHWVIDNFEETEPPPPADFMVYEVICSSLTVREQPNSSSKAIRYLHFGDRVNVTEIVPENGWLKLEEGGYCSGSTKYVLRID